MKVIDTGNHHATVEFEDPSAATAFNAGFRDPRHWDRHPETKEFKDFIGTEAKGKMVSVKVGENYIRVSR